MNLDKYNTIQLTQDSLQKLLAWRDDNKDLVRNYRPVFNEGLIKYDNRYQQYFKHDGVRVIFKVFINDLPALSFEHSKITGMVAQVEKGKGFNPNYSLDEAFQDVITVHASLMAFIEHFKSEKEYVFEGTAKSSKKSGNNKKSNKKSNVVKLKKVVKVHVPVITELRKRSAIIRRAESWGVRGHWRTLKSGKRCWVKPYVKGTGKEQAKNYSIEI